MCVLDTQNRQVAISRRQWGLVLLIVGFVIFVGFSRLWFLGFAESETWLKTVARSTFLSVWMVIAFGWWSRRQSRQRTSAERPDNNR
jgi:hypothetical protein